MHSGSVFHARHGRNGPNFVGLLLNFRTLTIFVFLFLFIILFYYYNESQDSLTQFENEKEKCQQNLDSVSAQLQVVYEHKSRLEKSLQAEKETNLKTNKEKDNLLKNEKIKAESQKQEVEKRYTSLQERLTDVQAQNQDLQLKYDSLKKEFNELKDDKQVSYDKAEENLKVAQNKYADLQRQNDYLVKEIGVLREKNAQLTNSLNEKENKVDDTNLVQQRASRASSLKLEAGAAPLSSTQIQQSNGPSSLQGPLSAIKNNDSTFVNHIIHGSQASDHNVIIENILPPFHQVPGTGNQITNNSDTLRQTRKQLDDAKQIQKPFDDSHQKALLENAKFPMAPEERQQGDQQPVLQHPLGEDQQNLLNLKPSKNETKQNNELNNDIENVGHLPINVRKRFDENNNDALQLENEDDDDAGENSLKRKKIPMKNNNEIDDDRDNAAEVKFKREDVQAGARVLNDPKEYNPAGIGEI